MAFNLNSYTKNNEAVLYDHLKWVWDRAVSKHGHSGDADYAFRTNPGEVNLLGARGFQSGTVADKNTNTVWDDTLFVIFMQGKTKRVVPFKYSSEFGSGGTALLTLGQHKYQLGFHRNDHTGGDNPHKNIQTDAYGHSGKQYRALNPYGFTFEWKADKLWYVRGGSSNGVSILRDSNRDLKQNTGESIEENNASINIHFGGDNENSTANWSEGCQVLLGWANYKNFIELIEKDTTIQGSAYNDIAPKATADGTRALIYTLVEGKDLVPYCNYPLDLGQGRSVSAANAAEYYKHTEKSHKGGYFPLGTNTVWHGGLHLHAKRGKDLVYACAAGELLAARLGETEEQGHGHYGSRNFILLKHTVDAATLRKANPGKEKEFDDKAVKTWYSVFMHLNPEKIEEGNAALKSVLWPRKTEPTGYKSKIAKLGLRAEPDVSKPETPLAKGAELKQLTPPTAAPADDNNWQYVEVVKGDTTNAGKKGWIRAKANWTETVKSDVLV